MRVVYIHIQWQVQTDDILFPAWKHADSPSGSTSMGMELEEPAKRAQPSAMDPAPAWRTLTLGLTNLDGMNPACKREPVLFAKPSVP